MKKICFLGSFLLLTACGTDVVGQFDDLQRDGIALQCKCEAELAVRTEAECRADEESDLLTSAQLDCLKNVFDDASDADVEAIECQLAASEDLLDCLGRVSCTELASGGAAAQVCQDAADTAEDRCADPSEAFDAASERCFS